MKKTYVIILLVICSLQAYTQSKLYLSLENVCTTSDSIFVQFSLTNTDKKKVKIFKPESQDICYGIVRVLIEDTNARKYQMMPCSEIIDLDAIVLSSGNSLYLSRCEKYVGVFKFSIKDATPFMPKGVNLRLTMEINLKDVNFEGENRDLVIGDFRSKNESIFKL